MTQTAPLRVLAISGSLRARSSNTELLRAAAMIAPPSLRIALYDELGGLPPFNPDLDEEGATPPAPVRRLRALVGAADALAICSPEYAHGVPGVLKNALDWLVSGFEMPDKPIALLSPSERSTYVTASLAETLRTMSTVIVAEASRTVPLDGRRLDAPAIAADVACAEILTRAIAALRDAAARYRAERGAVAVDGDAVAFWADLPFGS